MKRLLLALCNFLFLHSAISQNVGIGTTTPAFKLDVRNGSVNTDSAYLIGGSTFLSAKSGNTLVGNGSGGDMTTGAGNIAIGTGALKRNTIGNGLVAIGDSALFNNGTNMSFPEHGLFNTAVGLKTLYNNTNGSSNTAVGHLSLYQNTTGRINTCVGDETMFYNTTGNFNAGFGRHTLYFNTSGAFNTALGADALFYNQSGSSNTAVGISALGSNSSSSYNTGVGCNTLFLTTASQFNTAIGARAGSVYDLGWNNTIVGADANLSFNGQYNSIALGNLARPTENSKVRIGNSSNWSYEAFANWTNISDGRYKKNIQENVAGLSFIMKLRPVNYQLDVTGLSKKFGEDKGRENDSFMKVAIAEKEQMTWTGFVAQEVEVAASEASFNFSGVDKPRNEHGVYGLRYAEFVVPLVKAMQEQQAMIDELKKENNTLKELQQQHTALKARLETLEKLMETKL